MDLQILKNNLLFNHTYLQELTTDTTIDPQIPFSPKDLSDWYASLDNSSTRTMVDTWVRPMLSLLELEIHSLDLDDEHAFKLTTAYDHTTAIGICYVTPPGADLDTTTKGRFWMAQAVLAARSHEPALRWVILTNGDLWRLLDAEALRRYEAYVQIDVGQLAGGASDPSALRVFFRCFYRNAFEQDGDGKTVIEKLLETSDHATEKAEKHLKELVSGTDGIMAQLCMGLVRSTGKSRLSEKERDALYRDATTLLYRILFLLFAEARSLLPVENPNYADVSMQRLVEAAKEGQQRGLDHPQDIRLWSSLKRLSNAIYESDPNLDIPAYNGGLFDDDDHPYLREGFIANQFLSRALFDLAFLQNESDVRSIDYRDLSVRHLGNLYEGMIEYKLFVAEEPMLARRDKKGNIHFMTQEEGGGLRRNDQEVKAGEVYFAQSSGERRATGTYYTPEHIVDYIVRNTVLRGLEERRASLEEKLKAWLSEINTADPDIRLSLQRTLDEELLNFVEEQVLTFTVCDPAMGSGHFLVNAAHHIADFIVETLNLTIWENQSIDIEAGYWRRRAAERCLYGVDISEMAVELAKLSLWLVSMTINKPLSFLDHHFRHGNSLIGTHLADVNNSLDKIMSTSVSRKEMKLLASGQLSMLSDPAFSQHLSTAISLITKITEHLSETVADIKSQERDYEKAREELAPFRRLADILISKHFGLAVDNHSLSHIANHLVYGLGDLSATEKHILESATEISDKWNFFHWELEFFDPLLTDKGFNVVIGNPPYDELSEVALGRSVDEKEYFTSTPEYANGITGRVNLYRLFISKALTILVENGYQSFIVPMSLLSDRFTFELRREILTRTDLILIEAFPQKDDPNNRVFVDAKLPTCIYLIQNFPIQSEFLVRIHPGKYILDSSPSCWMTTEQIIRFDPENHCIPQITHREWDIVLNLIDNQEVIKLKDVATPTSGEIVFNQAFRKYLSENSTHTLVLRGGHVQRYELIENPKQGTPVYIDRERYKSNSKLGTKAYDHLKPRIVYQEGAALDNWRRIIATYLPANNICGHKICYFVDNQYSDFAFLAIFNSRIPEWFFRFISSTNSIAAYQVSMIPFPKIEPHDSEGVQTESRVTIQYLYEQFKDTENYSDVLEFVSSNLNQRPKQTNILHDLLAYLAEQMVEMNIAKQGQMKLFQEWLESQSGANVDGLTGKTYLLNFLGDYQKNQPHLDLTELVDILVKNKRKLAIDPNERGFQRSLEKRYQESLEVLLPIKKRLAMTDILINQIVYKLYGLTDDEIAIVEGKA